MTRLRFAVAPSAPLGVAALRVALANELFRIRHDGTLLLRFDDLDRNRCRPALAEQIVHDLEWFGIKPNAVLHQSDRLDACRGPIERLQRDGILYPCFESEEELRAKQELRRRRRQPLIYDRAMLALTPAQRQAAEAKGKRPYWRLKLSGRTLAWNDLVQGRRQADLSAVSDPVLVAADGTPAPMLASVIDDLDAGITHILRSEDSAGNTAIQMELFEILTGSAACVRFGHLPAPIDASGSTPGFRRFDSTSVRTLRHDGVEPAALAACLTNRPPAPLEELARQLAPDDFADAELDPSRMLDANREVLSRMEFADVAGRLPSGATEAFWRAIRGKVDLLKEARGWWEVVAGTIVPPVIDGADDLLAKATELLPAEPWDNGVWYRWVEALAAATGQSPDALAEPLRLALTGEDTGPDLADLLPLIGRSRVATRLTVAAT